MKKQLVKKDLLEDYKKKQPVTLSKHIQDLSKQNKDCFVFAFTRSSVFSSMIEGRSIDLENYFFNKETEYQNKEMQQIDDLIQAYQFTLTQ